MFITWHTWYGWVLIFRRWAFGLSAWGIHYQTRWGFGLIRMWPWREVARMGYPHFVVDYECYTQSLQRVYEMHKRNDFEAIKDRWGRWGNLPTV
jgi:hypothetical protein